MLGLSQKDRRRGKKYCKDSNLPLTILLNAVKKFVKLNGLILLNITSASFIFPSCLVKKAIKKDFLK